MGYHPFLVSMDSARVLVVGGGRVGGRRAALLASKGASVKVVALDFSRELKSEAHGGVGLVPGDLEKARELLDWADIVVIAVPDSPEARRLAREAMARGKLVNYAPDRSVGNLVFPFQGEVGGLIYAVSSLGVSGLAARRAAEKIEELLSGDQEIRCLLETHGEVKRRMLARLPDAEARMRVHTALWEDSVYRKLCAEGRIEEALVRALEVARSVGGTEL